MVLAEAVVGGIGIHHSVHPDHSRVQHRILSGDRVLHLVDKQHVSVIVLLEELEGQPLLDLSTKDRQEHSLPLFVDGQAGLNDSDDCTAKTLLLLVDEVESDLVTSQVLVRVYQLLKECSGAVWETEVELTFGDLIKVEI